MGSDGSLRRQAQPRGVLCWRRSQKTDADWGSAMTPALSVQMPFPPAAMQPGLDRVAAALRGTQDRLLVLTPVNTFFDPDKFSGANRSIVMYGTLSAAIVRHEIGSELVAAFVPPTAVELIDFLEQRGVPVHLRGMDDCNLLEFVDRARAEFDGAHREERKATNPPERWLLRATAQGTGIAWKKAWRSASEAETRLILTDMVNERRAVFRLFQEVSLGHLVLASGRPLSSLLSFRCDALLVADGQPIVVLEVDGMDHLKPEQRAKDDKRDRKLIEAGLCVVRVRTSDATGLSRKAWGAEKVTSMGAKHQRQRTACLLELVLQPFVDHYLRQHRYDPLYARRLDQAHKLLDERVRESAARTGAIPGPAERERMLGTLLGEESSESLPMWVEQRVEAVEDEQSELALLERLAQQQGFSLDNISIESDPLGGRYATVFASQKELRTPAVEIELKAPAGYRLGTVHADSIRDSALRRWLVVIASGNASTSASSP